MGYPHCFVSIVSEIPRLRSDVLLRACPKNDIVRELVILNGAKRSEVSHNMPAGAVLRITILRAFSLQKVIPRQGRKGTVEKSNARPLVFRPLCEAV